MEISGQLHVPTALPLGKEHGVHIEQETGWTAVPPVVLKRSKVSCTARNCSMSPPSTAHGLVTVLTLLSGSLK